MREYACFGAKELAPVLDPMDAKRMQVDMRTRSGAVAALLNCARNATDPKAAAVLGECLRHIKPQKALAELQGAYNAPGWKVGA